MNPTTTDTKPVSDRAVTLAATLSAALAAANAHAENDNAGLAWRVDDAAPYTDDARVGVRLETRAARAVVPVVAMLLQRDLWRVEAAGSPLAVRVRPMVEWSRAARRRTRVAVAFARAAGLDAEQE